MNIDSIRSGVILDHIQAGQGLRIYHDLNLDKLACSVAIIKNVKSKKMERKDIIKIDDTIELNLENLAYIDPHITVTIVSEGSVKEKINLKQPEKVVNIQKCKNPRCITSIEQELAHVFLLTDKEKGTYRCQYCEAVAQKHKK